MNNRELSCKERIGREFKSTEDLFLRLAGYKDTGASHWEEMGLDPEDPVSTWMEQLLEFGPTENSRGVPKKSWERQVVVLFSWGGPSDGLILNVGRYSREIRRAYYFYQDWFDGAYKKVRAGSQFEQAICDLFEPYLEGMELDD